MQRLPFHCPFLHCGKGFDNLGGIWKHIAISTHCDMYLQKLLQAQSVNWTKAVHPKTPNTTTTDFQPAQPPLGHVYGTALVSSFDNILFAEDIDNNDNEDIGFVDKWQTVESHTNTQYFDCKLLQLLDEANAPHYLFQQIMEWAQEAAHNGYSFQPKQMTQKAHITRLKTWLNLSPSCYPQQSIIELPVQPNNPPETVPITTFNFTAQLSSLLIEWDLVACTT